MKIHPHVRSLAWAPLRAPAPRPATLVGLLALAVAMSGTAVAGERINRDEVTLMNIVGGPVDSIAPESAVVIPLNGEPSFTFVQRAGEAVQLLVSFYPDPGTGGPGTPSASHCDLDVIVYGQGIQARFIAKSDAGELGEGSDVGGLPALDVDTSVTLQAIAREIEGCDAPNADEPDGDDDTWTISLAVTVAILRN